MGAGNSVMHLFTLGTTDHTLTLLGGHWVKLLKCTHDAITEPIIIMDQIWYDKES